MRDHANAIRPFRCRHLIAVLENPTEVRNIGTSLRNINAFGVERCYIVDTLGLLPDDWKSMRERKSLIKTSVSAAQWTFAKRFGSTVECLAHLRRYQYRSVVTSPHRADIPSIYLDEGDYTGFGKLAVWFGNEARGISDEAVAGAELSIAIPMMGMVESLNLGTSTGIVLYEVTRQRRAYQSLYAKRDRRRPRKQPLPIHPPLTKDSR